jgi:hypothetical protein
MLIIPFMLKANFIKEESLTAFLCIPKQVINKLQDECEIFLQVYDAEKDQDDDQTMRASQPDLSRMNSSDIDGLTGEREIHSKRRFRKSSGEKLFLFLKILFVMALFDSYFIATYLFVGYIQGVLEKRCISITAGGDLGAVGFSTFAILREYMIKTDLTIGYSSNISAVVDTYMDLYKNHTERVLLVK